MNTKISDAAVEAALRGWYANDAILLADFNGDGIDWPARMRAAIAAALPHLAADAVPVAYRTNSNIRTVVSAEDFCGDAESMCKAAKASGWTPLYEHPQPAALNEVSGNSGELGVDERVK